MNPFPDHKPEDADLSNIPGYTGHPGDDRMKKYQEENPSQPEKTSEKISEDSRKGQTFEQAEAEYHKNMEDVAKELKIERKENESVIDFEGRINEALENIAEEEKPAKKRK